MQRFVLYLGPMFSGKTTKLLAELDRYKYKGKRVLLVKPLIDQRYSKSEVCSHYGSKMDSLSINYVSDFKNLEMDIMRYDVLAVDEAFMFPGISDFLYNLYLNGMTIIISSLDLSSGLEPFDEVKNMMPYATEIYKCAAVCGAEDCYLDATLTYKIRDGNKKPSTVIEVGGAEMYEPRCVKHHPLTSKNKKED
jgi:thymidine kinase